MENTSFSVNVLGSKTGNAEEMIISDCNVAEINRIIAGDMNFTSESAAFPLSYSTNFIDDGSNIRNRAKSVKCDTVNKGHKS